MIRDLVTKGLYRVKLYDCKNEEAVGKLWHNLKETVCRYRSHGQISFFFFFFFASSSKAPRDSSSHDPLSAHVFKEFEQAQTLEEVYLISDHKFTVT